VSQRLRQVCAWCGVQLAAGAEPVSHGICPACSDRFELEGMGLAELHGRLAELAVDVESLSAQAEEGGHSLTAVSGALETTIGRISTLHRELVRRAEAACEAQWAARGERS
jgi:hypothetical protein